MILDSSTQVTLPLAGGPPASPPEPEDQRPTSPTHAPEASDLLPLPLGGGTMPMVPPPSAVLPPHALLVPVSPGGGTMPLVPPPSAVLSTHAPVVQAPPPPGPRAVSPAPRVPSSHRALAALVVLCVAILLATAVMVGRRSAARAAAAPAASAESIAPVPRAPPPAAPATPAPAEPSAGASVVPAAASAAPSAASAEPSAVPAAAGAPVHPSGLLVVDAPPDTRVFLDGHQVGVAPLAPISVSPGAHRISFEHPRLGKRVVPTTVRAGAAVMVAAELGGSHGGVEGSGL